MKLADSPYFKQFLSTAEEFQLFREKCIPLCAAENVVSNFVKLPLLSSAQEKYVMGGCLEYVEDDNFIGGEKVYPFYNIINSQCSKLFYSKYADARTLSGMNSVTTLLMSMTEVGDVVAITPPDCGGHASIPAICHRLGLKTTNLPYNYDKLDFDYEKVNQTIKSNHPAAILICLSDIVNPPDFSKIDLNIGIPIIYDATQTLGLIAGRMIANPFFSFPDDYPFILMGATHKTLAGPTTSLIMTRNMELAKKIETNINPTFLRNTQMHQKMSLVLALLESEYYGEEYSKLTVQNAVSLGNLLNEYGFYILNIDSGISGTHQVFFTCSNQEMKDFYENCSFYNITLNFKTKKLFRNAGIRIGTQEISRYGWKQDKIKTVAELLSLLRSPQIYKNEIVDFQIRKLINSLISKKEVAFTFAVEEYEEAFKSLFKIF